MEAIDSLLAVGCFFWGWAFGTLAVIRLIDRRRKGGDQ